MDRISKIAAWLFGGAMLGLSLFVTADVLSRKFLGVSFEGADELGGYTLAIGAGLAFVVALAQRAHMRIDVIYARLPLSLRAGLDWLSLVSLAAMAGLLGWLAWKMLAESRSYRSTAPTPWATPLAWPQSVWLASLALFLLLCLVSLAIATGHLSAGRLRDLNRSFGTSAEKDEVEAELADLQRRR
ncbi:TRAP transporter small permease subunit [Paracoccus ravus]|uniref:TRAP transporter small permease subunit n=1 Tax=Paracoccus ravus TaxID=2447760 RepID=UPI00106EAF39|nr:TRAP transporter small permease [Paracoccus ravus]